jgi:glutamate synthase (NADPH/NADH) large chain
MIAKKYGHEGLPDDTIHIQLKGTAARASARSSRKASRWIWSATATTTSARACRAAASSFVRLTISAASRDENIICGNTVLYGAIEGEAFFRGVAGERFACVTRARRRLSKARATTAANT